MLAHNKKPSENCLQTSRAWSHPVPHPPGSGTSGQSTKPKPCLGRRRKSSQVALQVAGSCAASCCQVQVHLNPAASYCKIQQVAGCKVLLLATRCSETRNPLARLSRSGRCEHSARAPRLGVEGLELPLVPALGAALAIKKLRTLGQSQGRVSSSLS